MSYRNRTAKHAYKQHSINGTSDSFNQSIPEQTLIEFLSFPLFDSQPIFDKFMKLPRVILRESDEDSKRRFLYIPGTRSDRVVLVCHADTVFDVDFDDEQDSRTLCKSGDFIYAKDSPIGADDRAGCALLWLLRDSGHSILILDGEECGGIGSRWLMQSNQDIADEINSHSFMIELDRENGTDFKTYDVGTDVFKTFIADKTGYVDAGDDSFTDICFLCRDICGVNFSVGYYNQHTCEECINYNEWLNTYRMMRALLEMEMPIFSRSAMSSLDPNSNTHNWS